MNKRTKKKVQAKFQLEEVRRVGAGPKKRTR